MDCLISSVNQDYDDIEIIVVDDASTDRSLEMAQKVRDPRIKILRHSKNMGYSAAKNTAIRAAVGEYIRPLDADDMMCSVGISKPLRYLEAHPEVDFVHGIAYKMNGGPGYGKALLKQHKMDFDTRCKIHAQGVMYRRNLHDKYGLYYEALKSKADKEFWNRLLILGARMAKIKSKLAFYRIHEKSMLAMRNRNKDYDRKMTKLYNDRIKQIKREGLTRKNTLWLS